MEIKTCSKCKIDKGSGDFYAGKNIHWCKMCMREYTKEHALWSKENGFKRDRKTGAFLKKGEGSNNLLQLDIIQKLEDKAYETAKNNLYKNCHTKYVVALIAQTEDFLNIKNKTHNHEYFFQTTGRDSKG